MKTVYTAVMTLALAVIWPLALALSLFGKRNLLHRLVPPSDIPEDRLLRVWIHAASVGESVIAFATAREIRNQRPGSLVFVSTNTPTGLERIMGLAADSGKGIIEHAFLAPFDHPLVVRAFLDRVQPTVFILVETEIWPSLLTALRSRSIPAAIINGRLGRRTLRRYRMFGATMRNLMAGLSLVCVQSRTFAGRYRMLGVPPERIEMLGNIKFDSLPDPSSFRRGTVRATLEIPQNAWVFVAGSTRPGEEEILARAFAAFRSNRQGTMMIIAPRHLNRVAEVENILGDSGLVHRKRSVPADPSAAPPEVLILDTLGELAGVFSCADAAFVGGSLRDYGGHNPLEPAALGVPVLFGPYMEQTGAKELLSGDAAVLVHDEHELVEVLSVLMDDAGRRLAMAAAGPKVVARFTGVLVRTIRCMESRRLFETVNGNAHRRSSSL